MSLAPARFLNPPSSFNWPRRKSATRLLASPKSFGANLATWSISSLKLTAPTLHFHGENFAYHPPQQTLEARVFQIAQRTDRFFLVRIEQTPAAIGCANLANKFANLVARFCVGGATPYVFHHGLVRASRSLERQRQRQRRPLGGNVILGVLARQIFDVIANLIGDSQRFAVACQHVGHVLIGAGEGRSKTKGNFKGGRGLLRENVEDRQRRKRLRRPRPAQLRALSDRQRPMTFGGDADHFDGRLGRGAAFGDEPVTVAN